MAHSPGKVTEIGVLWRGNGNSPAPTAFMVESSEEDD
jgi:hypothetical protein